MFFHIYVSSAVNPFTRDQLRDLLAACVANNGGLDITGMLLYRDGNFMQVLEGEEAAVRHIQGKIQRDTRHRSIFTIVEGPQPERCFPDWSMGFRDLTSTDVHSAPAGFNQFLNTPLTPAEFSSNPSRAHVLLQMFRDNA
jgi:hypothetical protein